MYSLEDPPFPGELFVRDSVGQSLRVGVKRLGKALFAVTGTLTAMHDSLERVASSDPAHWGWRGDVMDKQWDGIGNGSSLRWSC